MMSIVEREYEYKPKWALILLCSGFFGICAVVLGLKAFKNDRGLNISGILELSPENAKGFYWVLCWLSVGFVVAAGVLAVTRLWLRQRVAFTQSSILLPRSRWSSEEIVIDYEAITGLSTSAVAGQRFLHLRHRGGKQTITASLLPSKAAFEEVCELLTARVSQAPLGRSGD